MIEGEVGYLRKNEISQGFKVGTTNVLQCAVLVVEGIDKNNDSLIALAHINVITKGKAIEKIFEEFFTKRSKSLYIW